MDACTPNVLITIAKYVLSLINQQTKWIRHMIAQRGARKIVFSLVFRGVESTTIASTWKYSIKNRP